MNSAFAVIFDMDGVLVDSNPYHKKAIEKFLVAHNFTFTDDELKQKVWGRMNREWLRTIFGEEVSAEVIYQYALDKEAIYRQFFKESIEEVKGLTNLLDVLKKHQIPCAVGTSAPRVNVDFVFDYLHIGHFFSAVLDDSHVIHGKPNPEIYLKTAQTLGMLPSQCIVFEDSLAGTQAGKAAGTKVIGITTSHTRQELASTTDMVIDDFTQISINDLRKLIEE
ncbi:MAG: HAD family phosphatase [Thermoflexibacter sp.]|jgi:HAD superfamily hydrolase (TIGR01509 family)|nr:HAD family phosphatase [Thermoflexibacter sp.]